MDNNNWRPPHPGGEPAMEAGDWRAQVAPDSRQKIVNKITEILKKHLSFSGPEGINDLRRIAARFEEKIFTRATHQTDYLRKISMKMLTMETKSQNNAAGSSTAISVANNSTPLDSGANACCQLEEREERRKVKRKEKEKAKEKAKENTPVGKEKAKGKAKEKSKRKKEKALCSLQQPPTNRAMLPGISFSSPAKQSSALSKRQETVAEARAAKAPIESKHRAIPAFPLASVSVVTPSITLAPTLAPALSTPPVPPELIEIDVPEVQRTIPKVLEDGNGAMAFFPAESVSSPALFSRAPMKEAQPVDQQKKREYEDTGEAPMYKRLRLVEKRPWRYTEEDEEHFAYLKSLRHRVKGLSLFRDTAAPLVPLKQVKEMCTASCLPNDVAYISKRYDRRSRVDLAWRSIAESNLRLASVLQDYEEELEANKEVYADLERCKVLRVDYEELKAKKEELSRGLDVAIVLVKVFAEKMSEEKEAREGAEGTVKELESCITDVANEMFEMDQAIREANEGRRVVERKLQLAEWECEQSKYNYRLLEEELASVKQKLQKLENHPFSTGPLEPEGHGPGFTVEAGVQVESSTGFSVEAIAKIIKIERSPTWNGFSDNVEVQAAGQVSP